MNPPVLSVCVFWKECAVYLILQASSPSSPSWIVYERLLSLVTALRTMRGALVVSAERLPLQLVGLPMEKSWGKCMHPAQILGFSWASVRCQWALGRNKWVAITLFVQVLTRFYKTKNQTLSVPTICVSPVRPQHYLNLSGCRTIAGSCS